MKNIILIGFMGSGKSSVAHELAHTLKLNIQESDALVLSKSRRKSINDIFSLDGEIRFREMEIEIAKKLSGTKNSVISTGGGMIINKISIDYLKKNGIVIFLDTSFGEITKRLKGDTTRPLFSNIIAAQKLFQLRKSLYQAYADNSIVTDGKSVSEITNLIIKII